MSWRSEYPDLARTIDQLSARIEAHEKRTQPNTRRRGRPPMKTNVAQVAETAKDADFGNETDFVTKAKDSDQIKHTE